MVDISIAFHSISIANAFFYTPTRPRGHHLAKDFGPRIEMGLGGRGRRNCAPWADEVCRNSQRLSGSDPTRLVAIHVSIFCGVLILKEKKIKKQDSFGKDTST